MAFLLRLIVNALALWLTTLIVYGGVHMTPYEDTAVGTVLTYLIIGLIFGLVNGIIGTFIRIVAFPLYILTLGLISLVVNALLLLLVSWISSLMGFGLTVDNFWWAVLGALVLSIIASILGIFIRPRHTD